MALIEAYRGLDRVTNIRDTWFLVTWLGDFIILGFRFSYDDWPPITDLLPPGQARERRPERAVARSVRLASIKCARVASSP